MSRSAERAANGGGRFRVALVVVLFVTLVSVAPAGASVHANDVQVPPTDAPTLAGSSLAVNGLDGTELAGAEPRERTVEMRSNSSRVLSSEGPNLLNNPGCEGGDGVDAPNGWTKVANGPIECWDPTIDGGPKPVEGTEAFVDTASDGLDASIEQSVAVNGNRKYEIAGWVGSFSTSDYARIEVDYRDGTGTVLPNGSISHNAYPGPNGNYSQFNASSVAPSEAQTAVVRIVLVNDDGQNYADSIVDGLSFNRIASPPTISNFSATNPSSQDVEISFESDKQLTTIQVSLTGPESTTLTAGDFTESGSGPYNYTATYAGSTDGNYTATLDTAEGSDGLDGASSESDSVDVVTSADISVTVTAAPDGSPYHAGETVTYTFEVTNNGPSADSNVTLSPTVTTGTAGIENLQWDTNNDGSFTDDTGGTTTIAVNSSETKTVRLQGTVGHDATGNLDHNITSSTSSGLTDPDLSNNNASVTVNLNAAPTFTASESPANIDEDVESSTNGGHPIHSTELFGDEFSDADGDLFGGVVVTDDASTAGEGTWQYSTDGGTNWFDVDTGSLSASNGLLLSGTSELRFDPAADYNGDPGNLTVHAVDDSGSTVFTSGSVRHTYDVTADGKSSVAAVGSNTVAITVDPVNDPPVAEAGSNLTVDEDANVGFDGTGSTDVDGSISSYEWDFGDGSVNATGATVGHTYADPGTYTVTLTVEDAAGSRDTDTAVVTVNDTTVPSADAGSDQTVDEDVAVAFDASNSSDNVGIASYTWDFGDGATAGGVTATHTYTEPGTYGVTLTVTDAAGNHDTDTAVITVRDVTNPTADAGANRTADEDTVVAFDGSNSTDNVGVTSYTWDFGDGQNATGQTADHTYADPGTYTVTLTVADAAGNQDTDTATVTVEDVTNPTADAGTSRTVDEDTVVAFDAGTSSDNVGITSYTWDLYDNGTTDATGETVNHTYATPGRYNVTLTVADAAGNQNTDAILITVNDTTAPTAVAGPNQTVDEDTVVHFDGSSSSDNVGVTGYEWNFGDGSANATGATANHTYTAPGEYAVTLTVEDAAGNRITDTVVVTVRDVTAPTADAGTNRTVDEDAIVAFDAGNSSDNAGVTSYEWDFGDSQNATGQTANHTYADPGNYTVTLTVADAAGNQDTDTAVITVEDVTNPTADAGTNRIVDEDTVVAFDGSNSSDNVEIGSYAWGFGDGNTSTGETVNHSYVDPGTYTVTLDVTDAAGNRDTDTVAITVTDTTAPTADAGPNQTVDEDTVVTFDGRNSSDNAGVTGYSWAFGDGNASSGANVTHTYLQPGTYTVLLTVTDDANHTDTDSLTVTVDDTTSPIVDVGANRTVDEDTVVAFDGSNSSDNVGITSYEWDFGDGSANATGATANYTYVDPGEYAVTLTVEDAAGNQITETVGVSVRDVTTPTGDAGTNRTVDEDATVAFEAGNSTDNVGITSYEWTFGDGSAKRTGETVNHTYADPGTYTVTLDVTDAAGNSDSDTHVVTVNDTTPPVAAAGDNTTVRVGTSVTFDAGNSSDNGAITAYHWNFSDGGNATGSTMTRTYSSVGTFAVTLTVTDAAGHLDSDVRNVTVRRLPQQGTTGPSDENDEETTDDQDDGGTAVDGDDGETTDDEDDEDDGGAAVDEETTVEVDAGEGDDENTFDVSVGNVRPTTPVVVAFDGAGNATDNDGTDGGLPVDENVSVAQLTMNVSTRENFTVNVTIYEASEYERAGEAFRRETNSTPSGYVIVNHSVSDEDIENVTFRVRVQREYFEQAGLNTEAVAFYRDEGTTWRELDMELVRVTNRHYVFEATSPGLSLFVIGSTGPVFEVADASFSAETVGVSETVEVTVTVENAGGSAGTFEAGLFADGEQVTDEAITVSAFGEATGTLRHAFEEPGTYELSVGDVVVGSVVVEAATTTAGPTTPQEVPPDASANRGDEQDAGGWSPWVLGLLALVVTVAGGAVWYRRQT